MSYETIHVLSIEDNAGDARLIREMLGRASALGWDLPYFALSHADRLAAGLARLDEDGIDVVLTDLDLPDSQAGDTFARLRAHVPHLPIVVLTGREDAELARHTVRAGAEDYLFKREMHGSLLAHALLYAIERQRARAALQEAHDELERRVQARTVELAQANAQLRQEMAERAHIEESLRRSRESYHSFIRHSHEAIYCTEFDEPIDTSLPVEEQIDAIYQNAYMGECNQAMATMYGLPSVEAFLGQRLIDFHGGKDNPVNRATFRTFIESNYRSIDCETEEVTPQGEKRFFLTSDFGIVQDGYLLRIWGVATDITARKQAEETLRISLEKYRALFESFPLGITVADQHGQVIEANQESERLLGISIEEHSQRRIDGAEWRIIRPDGSPMPPEEYASVRALAENHRVENVEMGIVKSDGDVTWLSVTAAPLPLPGHSLVIAYGDVTARKQTEEALRQRETFLSTLLDTLGDAVFTIHMPERRITYVNRVTTEILGYQPEELMGQTTQMLYAFEADFAEYGRLLQDALAQGQSQVRAEAQLRHKDGHSVWTELHTTFLFDAAGRPTDVISLVRDMTDRKQAEAERTKLQEQLAQARRLESIGRLAGGVAHDFNNMLSVIIGNADMALQQIAPDTSLHSDLQEILQAARRSANLTQQLLAFGRKQVMAPSILDLNVTVAGMLKMLRRLIGEAIEVAWLPGDGLWPIKIDPGQIDQVLVNLCANARDAIAGVGTITLETRNVTFEKGHGLQREGVQPGAYVLLSVADNGRGLDEEAMVHLFEPYFTTKEVGQGSGLGLATVYGIVEMSGGFIDVSSQPGQGTTFKIYWPRCEGQVPVTQSLPPRLEGSREMVLLVEDEPANLRLGKRVLERLGYTVLTASLPSEALRHAQTHAGQIQLLVTDVVMPEMNGLDLAARIAPLNPGLRCLFMSGYAADIISQKNVLDEEGWFLQKPYSINELAAKVREVLEHGDEP